MVESSAFPVNIQELIGQREWEISMAFDRMGASSVDSYPDRHLVYSDSTAGKVVLPGENLQLYVGAQSSAGVLFAHEDSTESKQAILSQLRRDNVTVIICCCDDGKDGSAYRIFESDGISYAHACLDDGDVDSMAASYIYIEPLLRRALPLVRAATLRRESVLVHCNSGMHRSASIACAILMVERNMSLLDAFRSIIKGRVVCKPTFWRYLLSAEFAALTQQLNEK